MQPVLELVVLDIPPGVGASRSEVGGTIIKRRRVIGKQRPESSDHPNVPSKRKAEDEGELQEERKARRNAASAFNKNIHRLVIDGTGPAQEAESIVDPDTRSPNQRRSNNPRMTEDIESLVDSASDGDVGVVGHGGIPRGTTMARISTPLAKMRSRRMLP